MFLVLVFLLALAPAFWLSATRGIRLFIGFDKLLHAATFLVLTVWFTGQYARRSYWRVALGLLAFGLAIEVCQLWVSYRAGDPRDLAANIVGIGLGFVIALAGMGGWSLRLEQWWSHRGQRA